MVLRTPERTITSDRMEYDAEAGRAVAHGGVAIRERDVFLEGSQPRGGLRDRGIGAGGCDVQPPGLARSWGREADRERSPAHGHHRRLVHHLRPRIERVAAGRGIARGSITNPAPARRGTRSSASSAFPSCTRHGSRSPSAATASRDSHPHIRVVGHHRFGPHPAVLPQPCAELRRHPPAAAHEPARRGAGRPVPLSHRGRRRNDRGGSRARRPNHRRLPVARFVPTPVQVDARIRDPGAVRPCIRHRLPAGSGHRDRVANTNFLRQFAEVAYEVPGLRFELGVENYRFSRTPRPTSILTGLPAGSSRIAPSRAQLEPQLRLSRRSGPLRPSHRHGRDRHAVRSAPVGVRSRPLLVRVPDPAGDLHFTGYDFDEAAGDVRIPRPAPCRPSASTGGFTSITMSRRERRFTQTVEPRLFYLRVPYRDQDRLPLFDAGSFSFGYDHMFRENRFSGRPDRGRGPADSRPRQPPARRWPRGLRGPVRNDAPLP